MNAWTDEDLLIAEKAGFAAGLKEGARRERRALRVVVRRAMSKQEHNYCKECWYLGEIILERLASRKRKKRQ